MKQHFNEIITKKISFFTSLHLNYFEDTFLTIVTLSFWNPFVGDRDAGSKK